MAVDLNPAHIARCNGLVTQIGLALSDGLLTREAVDDLLVKLNGDGTSGVAHQQARELDRLFQEAITASQPVPVRGKLIKTIDFARGGNRADLEVFGPGARGGSAWGQNVERSADGKEAAQRLGWYDPRHSRQEETALHVDLLPDSRTVAGKQGWKCWQAASRAPREFRVELIASMGVGDGLWSGLLWSTAILRQGAPIPGGWSAMEIDHGEAPGAPKGHSEHDRYSTATHIGFDNVSKKPSMNTEPAILKRSHWHGPTPVGVHTFWIEVVENRTNDGFLITRGVDEYEISRIDTAEFHAKGYFLTQVYEWLDAWNIYTCTQASPTWQVKAMLDAMVLYKMKIFDMA